LPPHKLKFALGFSRNDPRQNALRSLARAALERIRRLDHQQGGCTPTSPPTLRAEHRLVSHIVSLIFRGRSFRIDWHPFSKPDLYAADTDIGGV
jgi:hypothetical protein